MSPKFEDEPGVANSEMYLHRRNGVYYFRRRVPTDLEGIIPPKQFHYSLKVRSRSEALKPYAAALARSEQEISEARGKVQNAAERGLTEIYPSRRRKQQIEAERRNERRSRVFGEYREAEICSLVSHWFETERRETEACYRDAFVLNSPEQRLEIAKKLTEKEGFLMGEPPEMNDLIISRVARSILDADDCNPPREWINHPLFRRFYGLVTEGLLYLNRIALSLIQNGTMPEEYRALPFAPKAESFHTSAPATPTGAAVTLEDLIERFSNDPKRQSLREGTRDEYKFIYRALREQIGGNKSLAAITRDDVRAVAETFLHLPARATLNNKADRLQDIAAKAKAAGKPQANVKTYNKRVQSVSAIFKYAVVELLILQNPAQNLSLPEPPSYGDEKGYSVEQLNAIFSDRFFRQFTEDGQDHQLEPNHELRPCYFWVPLIGLFHGMRSNEILQMKTTNVFEKDGVVVLQSEGEIKNHRAYRMIPLHPELKRLGFLSYVQNVKAAGYDQIFPDAKQAAYGKYSTWFQKPFTRCLINAGVKAGRAECFHALRHTWNGGLRRAEVPEEIRRKLGGWKLADNSSESSYGPDYFPRLLKELAKLKFDGLDLSLLLPKQKF